MNKKAGNPVIKQGLPAFFMAISLIDFEGQIFQSP